MFIKRMFGLPLGYTMFMAPPDDGNGGDPDPVKFSGKMVEKIDPVSNQKVLIPAELDAFFGHTISRTRDAVKIEYEGKYKPLLEALQAEAGEGSQAKAELEKIKLEAMTAEERAQANASKVIAEHEKVRKQATEEANTWKSRYEKSTIKTDIMSSFGDSKLCSPEQAMILFQIEGNARLSEVVNSEGKPTGEFETRVTLMLEDKNGNPEQVEGTPKELFKRWIALERNSHHVMNTMAAGSGTRPAGGYKGGRLNEEALMKLSPTERMKFAREQEQGK
jgi:hypothetical protein